MDFDPKEYWEERFRARDVSLGTVGYIALGEPFNRWMYRVRGRVFRRAFDECVPQRGVHSVLDVGTGSGFYIERWREAGAGHILGWDLTDTSVEKLKGRFPTVQFQTRDISADSRMCPADSIDAISAFDVLFHIVDDKRFAKAIKNMYGMLRPGGLLIFTDNFVPEKKQTRTWISILAELLRSRDVSSTARDAGTRVFAPVGTASDVSGPEKAQRHRTRGIAPALRERLLRLDGYPRTQRHYVSRSERFVLETVRTVGFEVIYRRPAFVLMNQPVAAKGLLMRSYWRGLQSVLERWPQAGSFIGGCLFPLELLLVNSLRTGLSSVIVVCKKPEHDIVP